MKKTLVHEVVLWMLPQKQRPCYRRCGQIHVKTPPPHSCAKVVSAVEKAKFCDAFSLQVAYHHFDTFNLEETHKIT